MFTAFARNVKDQDKHRGGGQEGGGLVTSSRTRMLCFMSHKWCI